MAVSQSPLYPLCLYAIMTLLCSDAVKSQSSNYTELFFNLTDEIVTTVSNGTTLNLTWTDGDFHHKQEESNVTLITEDNERFQRWEDTLRLGQCHREVLHELSDLYCAQKFYDIMASVSEHKWCSLPDIIRPYNDMTLCLETVSRTVGCFYPNPTVQELFLQIHSHYFRTCSSDEPDFMDPPPALLLTLTLLPVALIPVLVYVVVCKTQKQE